MIPRLAVAIAAALLLVACGGDGAVGTTPASRPPVTPSGPATATPRSPPSMSSGPTRSRAHADGDVSAEELAELTALVDQARAQIDAELPEPTTTTTEPPSTTTEPPPPAPVLDVSDDDDDDDKPGKRRPGRGRGGDDGDDDDDD